MKGNELEKYDQLMKNLSDEYLSIHTDNYFCDVGGMHIWHLTSCLEKMICDENLDCKEKVIASFDNVMVIPSESTFCEEFKHIGFASGWDLCDSLSGDMLALYETLVEPYEGIKDAIAKELDLDEAEQFESDIMYIPDITYDNIDNFKTLLSYMFLIKEGSCAHYCKIAAILLNWDKESEIIKALIEDDWKLKNYDSNTVVMYKKI